MQQCWLKLVYHCLEPGAALENMFAWMIVAFLQNLWAHLCFWGVFLHRNWLKVTFKLKILVVYCNNAG